MGGFRPAQECHDYLNLADPLPLDAVVKFASTAAKKTNTTGNKSSTEGARTMAAKMRTIEGLRFLVHVITIAKSPEVAAAKSGETYAIAYALKDFPWKDFNVGTKILDTTFREESL